MHNPIKALGGNAKTLQAVISNLVGQLHTASKLPERERKNYVFKMPTQKLATKAQEEWNTTICSAEAKLDKFVKEFYGKELSVKGECAKIVTTKSRCPKTQRGIVMNALVGEDIPSTIHSDIIASPDRLLAELFPPTCHRCSLQEGSTVKHPTTMSFTRYMAPHLADKYRAIERIDDVLEYIQSQLELAHQNMPAIVTPEYLETMEQLRTLESLMQHRRNDRSIANYNLDKAILGYNHRILFVSTRIKGNSRVQDKIEEIALDHAMKKKFGKSELKQIKDFLCARITTRTIKDAAYEARAQERKLIHDYTKNAIDEPMEEFKVEGHESIKQRFWYGHNGKSVLIGTQHMSLAQFQLDQSTHETYEEARKEFICKAAEFLPVASLEEALSYIIQYRKVA